MARSTNTIDFISREPASTEKTPAVEQKEGPRSTMAEIAERTAREFTTPEAKRLFAETLKKELEARKSDLSPGLIQQLENSKGELNMLKVANVYGLEEHLVDQITPDGEIVSEDAPPKDLFHIPERPANAKTGDELFAEWGLNRDMNAHQEELTQRIIREIEQGNVPDACRQMYTDTMEGQDGTKITYTTSAGYLAVGSNENNIKVPLSGPMAKQIADHFGWVLPTAAMATNTDDHASLQLAIGGETFTKYDTDRMSTLEYARKHNQRARDALAKYLADYNAKAKEKGQPPLTEQELTTKLIRGEKKNIFIGQRSTQGGIGIGGLLNPVTKAPIQPYQYPHQRVRGPNGEPGFHGDYSQSTAIYGPMVTVTRNGRTLPPMHLYDALQDPNLARILNGTEAHKNDGTFDATNAYTAPNRRRPHTPPPSAGNNRTT